MRVVDKVVIELRKQLCLFVNAAGGQFKYKL